jgi:RHS repeat-associated protein
MTHSRSLSFVSPEMSALTRRSAWFSVLLCAIALGLAKPTSAQPFFNQTDSSASSIGSWYGDNWNQLGSGFSGTLNSLTVKCSTGGGNFPGLLTDPFYYGSVTLNEFSDSGYSNLVNTYPLGQRCTPIADNVTFSSLDISLVPSHYYRLDTYDGLQNASVVLLGTNSMGVAMYDVFSYGYGRIEHDYQFYPYIESNIVPLSPPSSMRQLDGALPIIEGGTTSSTSLTLSAVLPSASSGSLQVQVELEPSSVAFTNQPNLTSAFVNSGAVASVVASGLIAAGYHWQARSADTLGNVSSWQTISSKPADADFFVYNPTSGIVLQDTTTRYAFAGQSCSGTCDLNPLYNHYVAPQNFNITKITFNWSNSGYITYGNGNYVAAISSTNNSAGIIATSVNSVSIACASPIGCSSTYSGELDFNGQIIPANFYLDFYAIGGGLQGGNNITVSNMEIWGSLALTPPPTMSTIGGPSQVSQNGFTSEPIDTATGDYYVTHTDVTALGKGLPFNFTRAYNSLDSYNGPLGWGWTHSFNILLSVDPNSGTVSIKEADGHEDLFTPTGGGGYMAGLTGLFDTLVGNTDGSFTLTRKNPTKLNFTSDGELTTIVDRNGNMQTLNYDGSGNLISVIDTGGRVFRFTNGSGRITSLSDPIGRTWIYTYDANGNLASVTDAAGGVTQYTYDGNHRMLTATDARGVTFLQNTYDGQGRVATQTNARNFVTTLCVYNSPVAGTTTFADPLGNATQHVYDGSFRLIKIIDANGGTISYAYDASNDRTSITNQDGKTINMTYDGNGNATSITNPLGNIQTFTYDSKNDLLTATSPKGASAAFSYDTNENLLSIKDAVGNATSLAYNSAGLVTSKTDARSNVTSYAYDVAGDLTRVTDALGNSATLTYDGVGRLLSATDPNGHSASVAYDTLSRIIKTKDALNNATQFSYDAIGNLLKITDANGNATSYAYDATNNLTAVTDALGKITTYAYDANNNRTSFTNAKGNATSYVFDPINRLTQITDPLSFTTSYAYDAVGNTISTTDANGKTNQYTYDLLNRLSKGSYADGSSVSFGYDNDGNRTTMTDSRGTTTYSYDALERVLSVASPNGATVQYAYDALGNRTSLVYPDGRTVQYQYDALNRLSQVTDWASKTTQYSYDPAGNLDGFTYPNGAVSAYTFDPANRLLDIVNSSGSKVLSSFAYALDNVGNRMQVTSAAGGITNYSYDPLYRLTSWTAPSGQPTQYTYDPVGNRLAMVSSGGTTPYTYDASDRLLSAGTTSYGYDKNGNQISKTTGSTTFSYSYDALNHLIATSGGGIDSQYQYNGDGNRVVQTIPTGRYQYLNDTVPALPVVLNEAGPDGNIDYLYGLSMISETSSTFQYFYQVDGLGSAASLTDATGALKASYSYDPWGKLLVPIDPLGTKNKYKFAGEALDPGTGLYYLRARQYDSPTGRFMTRDRFYGFIHMPLSLNRYLYTLGNPVRYVDPRGLSSIDSEASEGTQSTQVSPPSIGPSLGTQARCFGVPLCTTLNGLSNVSNGISQVQSQEQQDPQFQSVIQTCVEQVGSGLGGGPQSTGGVRACVQGNYPYIGPAASTSLLSDASICADAEGARVSLTGCPVR